MGYAFITFPAARAALAARLQDTGLVYWNQPGELDACLIESLRFHQALTGAYKQKIAFQTQLDICFYDLPLLAGVANGPAVAYTATDVEVANNVLAALLEPPLAAVWTGTGQFSIAQLQVALQNRLNRFIGDTGCTVTRRIVACPPPPAEVTSLPDSTLDVRRVAWRPLPLPYNRITNPYGPIPPYYPAYPLGRMDEWAEQAYVPGAAQDPMQPFGYSTYGVPPVSIRTIPPPIDEGAIDSLLVMSGPTVNLDPLNPVVLGLPDNLSPALKWGVLAEMLASDGPSRDYARAAYCEQRYQEFVQLAALMPMALLADIGNAGCGIGSVIDLDAFQPDWQRTTGPPSFVGMCGRNMACIGQTPDGTYGVGLWVSANASVDTTGFLQIGRDQIAPVLDYAQHIACFKMGGAEFDQTAGLYQNLIAAAKVQNARLNAVAFYRGQLEQPAQKSELQVNRLTV
jgi:hypothetical protein